MHGAASEEGRRQHEELRGAQRLSDRHGVPSAGRHRAGSAAGGRWRAAHQERRRDQQHPGQHRDRELGGTPVIVRQQPAREGRDRHRRDAHAGRDQRDREAAVLLEPAGHGDHHGREDRSGGRADQDAVDDLELDQAGGPAGERQARAQQHGARQHDDLGAETIGECAPEEAADAHVDEHERHGERYAGARPARRFRHRLQEHCERERRAHGDAAQQGAGGDDDPAVLELHGQGPPSQTFMTRSPYDGP